MNDFQQLNEGKFIDGAILLVLTTRLLKPFKTWKAFKLHLIDEDGNVLKKPKTSDEKDAWTMLDKFLAKIKRMFLKHKLVGSLLTFYVLLKEESQIEDTSMEYLVEQRIREDKVKDINFRLKTEMMKEGISEDEFYTILTNIKIKEVIENERN